MHIKLMTTIILKCKVQLCYTPLQFVLSRHHSAQRLSGGPKFTFSNSSPTQPSLSSWPLPFIVPSGGI